MPSIDVPYSPINKVLWACQSSPYSGCQGNSLLLLDRCGQMGQAGKPGITPAGITWHPSPAAGITWPLKLPGTRPECPLNYLAPVPNGTSLRALFR